ncbi:MAG TPA: MFS transporter [Candidatus Pseudogracilibacillus intestinigallinarum]|uniref:MFS transporter n=1 Tax=Candidatus Pseudogracilibacillus intestinigallinarum TaxID=2838742 RepID=A0A9D1PM44_9BACI|nr:MFS transporter [Candidatus Pseudogracilibacillus intestinigallinarum]
MEKKNFVLAILLGNLFIAFLGIGLVIPVLPTIMNELHLTGKVVGYLVAAFAITQLIASPIAGQWVDKYGRKRMIVIGLFVFSFSEYLFGIGTSVEILFVSRFFGGISAAFIMPAVTAYIADITTLETRSKALGYMSAAISTGFIIGPGIGGFLAEYGSRVPFFAAAVLAGLAAVLSIITLKEPERQTTEEEEVATVPTNKLKRVVRPAYIFAFLILFISSFGLMAFESLFSLYVDHKFGFTPKDIAIIITGAALVGAITQVLLFDKLTKRFGEVRLVRYCLWFSGVFVFLMTTAHSYAYILFVTIFIFTGFDLLRPAITSYLSKVAGNEQGFVGGMNSMFTSIGNVLGPMVGGALFDINLDYPYYFTTFMMIVAIITAYIWKAPERINIVPTKGKRKIFDRRK